MYSMCTLCLKKRPTFGLCHGLIDIENVLNELGRRVWTCPGLALRQDSACGHVRCLDDVSEHVQMGL